jgi:biotin-(acetyl-CoA carboxylase) ligase
MAGILCESMAVEAGELRFVVGIGLNLKPDPERERASGRVVADLESASGKAWDPEDLLSLVLPALEVRINTWLSQGFGVLHPDYLAVLWGRGGETVVRTGREVLQGRLEGVGKDGRLWLRLATGEKKEIASAVSVEAVAPGREPV